LPGTTADALDNTTDVETPERIRFRHHVAGPVRRGLAYLIDLCARGAIVFVTGLLAMLGGFVVGKATMGVGLVVFFMVEWGYNILFETFWRGQTPGKRALGLRVVKEGGYPVGFIDSVLRNLLRAADFLPMGYVLGLLVMGGDTRYRRIGDRVAGTMVVVETSARVAAPVTLTPPATAEELAALPHRPPLSPDEVDALAMFLRRAHLSPARRVELAEVVAPVLAARMHQPVRDPVRFLGLLHERHLGARRPAPADGKARRT
jgi:uncharacterized RDD family membrane protein YckC